MAREDEGEVRIVHVLPAGSVLGSEKTRRWLAPIEQCPAGSTTARGRLPGHTPRTSLAAATSPGFTKTTIPNVPPAAAQPYVATTLMFASARRFRTS